MELVLEKRCEDFDDLVDKARELLDRFKNRITLANTRVVEHYTKSECEIVFHFRLGNGEEHFVHLQREPGIHRLGEHAPQIGEGCSIGMTSKIDLDQFFSLTGQQVVKHESRDGRQQEPVFVYIVQTMETP